MDTAPILRQRTVSQALVPTLNGTRTAIREVLVLDDQVRQQLIEAGVANLEVAVHRLLTQRKSRFVDDVRRKHAQAIVSKSTLDLYERSEHAKSRGLSLGWPWFHWGAGHDTLIS